MPGTQRLCRPANIRRPDFLWLSLLLLFSYTPLYASPGCAAHGEWLQVLGSGGPELTDGRASSGYLLWRDGKARVLVDMGSGSLLRFEESGAQVNDLDVILLSHLHVDHSSDLPALIKASFFTGRNRDLPLYGPTGNQVMPSTTAFVQGMFGAKGVYRYLSDYLDGSASYRLVAHDVPATGKAQDVVVNTPDYTITAVPVHHGPIPVLAWRVLMAGKTVVFSGDMNNDNDTLTTLAENADYLVADHAIPEGASGVARNLHMPPSVIGQIAAKARVKQLILSHRMLRTLGQEENTLEIIKRRYTGPVHFANDLQCYKP